MRRTSELIGAVDTSVCWGVPTEVQREHSGEVQSVPDGFGFHLKASEYTWITLVFETKEEAEAAHSHAAKAVTHAKALKIVNR